MSKEGLASHRGLQQGMGCLEDTRFTISRASEQQTGDPPWLKISKVPRLQGTVTDNRVLVCVSRHSLQRKDQPL